MRLLFKFTNDQILKKGEYMKQFNVYQNPLGKYIAVKQGWSWPGFFFAAIWALVKQMWMIAGITFVLSLAFIFITANLGDNVSDIISRVINLICALLFGYQGNKFYESNLISRGFELKETVIAANNDGAIAMHINNSKTE